MYCIPVFEIIIKHDNILLNFSLCSITITSECKTSIYPMGIILEFSILIKRNLQIVNLKIYEHIFQVDRYL